MYSMVLMAALTTGVDVPDLGRRGSNCCGCSGGYYGCSGCYGGCNSCGGGRRAGRRHGCSGGCYGCSGGYYGCSGGCYGCSGVVYQGCSGMYQGCSGGMYQGCCGGVIHTPVAPAPEKAPAPTEKKKAELMGSTSATLVVNLPADAKLRIDETATTSTGTNRVFQSPALEPGKVYQYTLRAEIIRDGKPVKMEKVVEVEAGQTKQVPLTLPTTAVAQ
jgi:uncharacterized protein (TIGR03000 family)